ncbi:MAG: transposase [Oligoflexus sp.]|nr:transposase [Oligoflexus sp.]
MATKKARRQFTKEFKIEAAKMVVEQEMKQTHVARNLGIADTLLGHWVAEYKSDTASAFPGKGNLKPDDERTRQLEQQLRRVTMERDILKKAIACVL